MSTVTVVPTVEPANWPPRVRLDVTDTGTPNLNATTVVRLDPDGVLRPARTEDGNPLPLTTSGANRVGLLYDYEPPYQVPVSYTTLESPTTVSAEVTVPESRVWLIPPGIPELALPITVAEIGERTRKSSRGVFYPMRRKFPVVQTGGQRKAAEYTLRLLSTSLADRDDVESLFEDEGVLLLNVPASKGWGIGAEYVSVGDLNEARPVKFPGEPSRFWDLPLLVVDRPVGGTQAERTYADTESFASYSVLNGAYANYGALTAGP